MCQGEWNYCVCVSLYGPRPIIYQLMTSRWSVNSCVCSSVTCTLCTLQDKLTPLMCAAYKGYTDVVQVLLSQQDVDINIRDQVCPSQWKRTLRFHMSMLFLSILWMIKVMYILGLVFGVFAAWFDYRRLLLYTKLEFTCLFGL